MPQNSNLLFLKDMINVIGGIDKNYIALKNLLESKYTQIKDSFKSEINDFILILEKEDSYEDNYLKDKIQYLDNIKQKYKKYNESLLEMYESNYLQKIREHNEQLKDLIYKIIPDFYPPKANSFSNDEKICTDNIYDESSSIDQNGSLSLIDGLRSFYNKKMKVEVENMKDIEKNRNKYFNSICHKEKAIYLCDECNELLCQIWIIN